MIQLRHPTMNDRVIIQRRLANFFFFSKLFASTAQLARSTFLLVLLAKL